MGKSAIGIGSLLVDGLGDTVRVSLTEDPDKEYEPCNQLCEMAEKLSSRAALERQDAVSKYTDHRDITSFSRRSSTITSWLHKDGSVFATYKEMAEEEFYKQLGCRMELGMPVKDVATVDALLVPKLPTSFQQKRMLEKLSEAGIGLIVPKEVGAFKNSVVLYNNVE